MEIAREPFGRTFTKRRLKLLKIEMTRITKNFLGLSDKAKKEF